MLGGGIRLRWDGAGGSVAFPLPLAATAGAPVCASPRSPLEGTWDAREALPAGWELSVLSGITVGSYLWQEPGRAAAAPSSGCLENALRRVG